MRHQPSVLEQVVQHVPWGAFDRLVQKHRADERARGFDSRDHLLALLAAALGGPHVLRQTVAALAPQAGALRLMGATPPPASGSPGRGGGFGAMCSTAPSGRAVSTMVSSRVRRSAMRRTSSASRSTLPVSDCTRSSMSTIDVIAAIASP